MPAASGSSAAGLPLPGPRLSLGGARPPRRVDGRPGHVDRRRRRMTRMRLAVPEASSSLRKARTRTRWRPLKPWHAGGRHNQLERRAIRTGSNAACCDAKCGFSGGPECPRGPRSTPTTRAKELGAVGEGVPSSSRSQGSESLIVGRRVCQCLCERVCGALGWRGGGLRSRPLPQAPRPQ